MKITNVNVTPVNIPLEIPILWTGGYYPDTSKAVIEVETDEGLIGLGEVPSATEYFAYRVEKNGIGGEMDPRAVADYCLRMREEHGSTFFEGKLIQGDPQLEIDTVKAMREALGPRALIRLDSYLHNTINLSITASDISR